MECLLDETLRRGMGGLIRLFVYWMLCVAGNSKSLCIDGVGSLLEFALQMN